jgi:hypothetical protein
MAAWYGTSVMASWLQEQCMLNVGEHKMNFKSPVKGLKQLNITIASIFVYKGHWVLNSLMYKLNIFHGEINYITAYC